MPPSFSRLALENLVCSVWGRSSFCACSRTCSTSDLCMFQSCQTICLLGAQFEGFSLPGGLGVSVYFGQMLPTFQAPDQYAIGALHLSLCSNFISSFTRHVLTDNQAAISVMQ